MDATDEGARSAGLGRGSGGDDADRWWLELVPVTRINQVEMPCAISDRGDRASGHVDDGACAWIDAAASGTKKRHNAAVLKTLTCTIFLWSPPNGLRG